MIRIERTVDVESLYLDDNWRLTQETIIRTVRFLGLRIWKQTNKVTHKIPAEALFTSAAKGKELKVGFANEVGG